MLTTAVKYIGSKDALTLLEIAEEERRVLEPLLGLREGRRRGRLHGPVEEGPRGRRICLIFPSRVGPNTS